MQIDKCFCLSIDIPLYRTYVHYLFDLVSVFCANLRKVHRIRPMDNHLKQLYHQLNVIHPPIAYDSHLCTHLRMQLVPIYYRVSFAHRAGQCKIKPLDHHIYI